MIDNILAYKLHTCWTIYYCSMIPFRSTEFSAFLVRVVCLSSLHVVLYVLGTIVISMQSLCPTPFGTIHAFPVSYLFCWGISLLCCI